MVENVAQDNNSIQGKVEGGGITEHRDEGNPAILVSQLLPQITRPKTYQWKMFGPAARRTVPPYIVPHAVEQRLYR